MNTRLMAALLAAGATLGALPAAAEIVLYGRDNFEGRSMQSQGPNDDLGGFSARASSAIVNGRPYEVCEGTGFSGRCMVLRPGRYPHLDSMGMNDRISSVRPIRGDVRYEDNRYAPQPPLPAYDARRRPDERLFEAQVIDVRAVYGQPEQRCWVDRQQVADNRYAPPSRGNEVGGAIIGGILGGVLGHQVGSGRGNDLATGIGAVGGALAGANVARDRAGNPTYTQDVRRCENVPTSGDPAYYDVTYRFRGEEHHMQMTSPPPATITVNDRGEPRFG
jgi:uncharacterized protein YcfJ